MQLPLLHLINPKGQGDKGLHCSNERTQVPSAHGNSELLQELTSVVIVNGQLDFVGKQIPLKHFTGIDNGQVGLGHFKSELIQDLSAHNSGVSFGQPFM